MPVAAVVLAFTAMLTIAMGWDVAGELIVPVALVTLAAGVLLLARVLKETQLAALERAAGETEERTRRILDRSHEAYIAMDSSGLASAWNASAEAMFGWSRAEAIGRPVADLIMPEDEREQHRVGLKRFHATGHGPVIGQRTELVARHRNGAEIPVELSLIAVDEAEGEHSFHGFVRDITERRMLEAHQAELLEAAQKSARIDALTSLPNRRGWDEALTRELARAGREQTPFCVALLDLDHFKDFNDSHGHPAGDRLLRLAASAWKLAIRQADLIARYGGEEFAVLLPVCGLEEAMEVIERLREVTPEEQTVSAGVAEWNGYGAAEALIDRADLALYNAKRDGRDRTTAAA